jgi:hypothetical protein
VQCLVVGGRSVAPHVLEAHLLVIAIFAGKSYLSLLRLSYLRLYEVVLCIHCAAAHPNSPLSVAHAPRLVHAPSRRSLPSLWASRNLSLLCLGSIKTGGGVCNEIPIARVTMQSEKEFKLQRTARGTENSLSGEWVSFTAVSDGVLCVDCELAIERSYDGGLLRRWSPSLPRLPLSLSLIPSSRSIAPSENNIYEARYVSPEALFFLRIRLQSMQPSESV